MRGNARPSRARARCRGATDDSGQTLVEYALIIGIVAMGAFVALTFLSGEIKGLFSSAGNSLNKTEVATAPPPPPPPPYSGPPPSGTSVSVDPPGPAGPGTYTYLNPGPTHDPDGTYANCGGSQAACSGHAGFYSPNLSGGGGVAGSASGFSSATGSWSGGYTSTPPWSFTCTWKTSGQWGGGAWEAGCW